MKQASDPACQFPKSNFKNGRRLLMASNCDYEIKEDYEENKFNDLDIYKDINENLKYFQEDNFNNRIINLMINKTKFNIFFFRLSASVASQAYKGLNERQPAITSGNIEIFYNKNLSSSFLAVYSGFYNGFNSYFLGIPGTNLRGSTLKKNILVDLAQDILVSTGDYLPMGDIVFKQLQELINTNKKIYISGHSLGGSLLYQISKKFKFPNVYYFAYNMGSSPLTPQEEPFNFNSMIINSDLIAISSPVINYKFAPVLEYNPHSLNQFIKIFNDYI